jgi:hypothetical protein
MAPLKAKDSALHNRSSTGAVQAAQRRSYWTRRNQLLKTVRPDESPRSPPTHSGISARSHDPHKVTDAESERLDVGQRSHLAPAAQQIREPAPPGSHRR